MSLHAVKIQEINITNSSKKKILEELEKFLVDGTWEGKKWPKNGLKILRIMTPNPEQIVLAHKSRKFADLLNQADVALPDGVGLVWASKIVASGRHGISPSEISRTIPGVDFMEDLVAMAANRHVPIALIGGEPGVAVKAFECLRQSHPDLVGVAMDAPEFVIGPSGLSLLNHESGIMNNGRTYVKKDHNSSFTLQYSDTNDYFEKIATALKYQQIGIVFVALGAPKQEFFAEKLVHSLEFMVHSKSSKTINHKPSTINPMLLMSVGGSLDEISGRIPRAPHWISNLGLKWLWRLVLEPWRIKRQFALLKFMGFVLLDMLSKRSK